MSLFRSLEDERVKKLKTLKYGDSKPLITKDIPLGTEFQDGPNPRRNGLELQAGARVDDLLRITKLLASKPGLKFVANNTLLNFSQAQETLKQKTKRNDDGSLSILSTKRRTGAGNILNKGAQGAAATAKVIAATLAQVPVSGTGQHFTYAFAGDRGYLSKEGAKIVKQGGSILPTAGGTGILSNFATTRSGKPKLIRTSEYQRGGTASFPENSQPPSHEINPSKYPTQVRKDTRYGLGDPGKRVVSIASGNPYASAGLAASNILSKVDKVNALEPNSSRTEKDFIKFNFQVITPPGAQADSSIPKNTAGTDTSQPNPTDNPYIQFRAFLDSFDDNFSADWSEHKYIGRGESFYTYGGFNRNINISFKIAAQTELEMKPLYKKIVYLASVTAPTYSSNFMRGTIVRATVGDYLFRVPGVVNSVNYSWDKNYPWAIKYGEELQQELPMVLNCTLSFTPIHDFVPQTGLFNFITATDDYRAYFQSGKSTNKTFDYTDKVGNEFSLNEQNRLNQLDQQFSDEFGQQLSSQNIGNDFEEPATVDEIVFDEFEEDFDLGI